MAPDTSVALVLSPSIVKGFGPDKISSSRRSLGRLDTEKTLAPLSLASTSRHKSVFMLGGSSEHEDSSEDTKSVRHSSSLTSSLEQSRALLRLDDSPQISHENQASDGALSSDDSDVDSDVSESAIEEESDAWEDDLGNQPNQDEELFKFSPTELTVVSKKSLLTTGIHESERAAALNARASLSAMAEPSFQIREPPKTSDYSRSRPMAITTGVPQSHFPTSPRTTRTNMLSTELTDSLKQNLLWERQFKNTTSHALFKRRHAAHDNLSKVNYLSTPDFEASSKKASQTGNSDLTEDVFPIQDFHVRGW